MTAEKEEREVLEPEVLPPEGKEGRYGRGSSSTWDRAHRAFGPVLAGVFLDFVDLATMGGAGFLLGALAGFYVASVFGLSLQKRIMLAAATGVYCLLPATQFLPLATLIGAWVRFRETPRAG